MTRLVLLLGGSGAVSIVVKATVIAALGLAGSWLGRGSRAAVRHAVLGACFAALLGLPVASFLIPPVHLAVAQAPMASSGFAETVETTLPSAQVKVNAPSVSRWALPSVGDLLFAGWIVGVVFFLSRILLGLRQVSLLRRSGLPWREGQAVVERLAAEAGVHRRVEVLLHCSLVAPVTCGVIRPAVLLPPDARGWDGEDLSRAIVHELEHVRRWDWVSQCLARVVCAVYWFHPLVWMAWRRFVLEAERACDDAVLRRSEATAYADQLVELARRLSTGRRSPALAMASRSDLCSRVRAVLDGGQQRGGVGKILVTMAFAVAAVVVVTMSPLRVVAAPQSGVSAEALPEFEVASVKPFVAGPQGTPAGIKGGPGTSDPERFRFISTLKGFLMAAYGVTVEYISGPAWLDTTNPQFYDIEATIRPGATKEQMLQMLQSLLKQRFQVTMHRETRELPLYELTVAGKGPQLKEYVEGSYATGGRGMPSGLTLTHVSGGVVEHASANKETIAQLAEYLSFWVKRPVVDRTGLAGLYNYNLDFALPLSVPADDVSPASAPDLITAVRVQLGLKLTARKGPVEIVVIDHAEKSPVEN